jgi:glycosyltransferase involved in cell wall biosynthesis
MRIGLIAPPWVPVPPPRYGGTEAVVDRLARGFVEAGADVLLYTTGDSTCPVPREWVLPTAQHERIGAGVVELRHLIHAYEAMQDCDIVHDHTVFGPVYADRFPWLRVVTTNHGPFNDELLDIYGAMAYRVPIIAISHAQAAAAHRVPIAAVIHHGIDVDEVPVGEGRGGYLLFLGRMSATKGAREAALVARSAGVPLLMAAKMREREEYAYFEEHVEPLLGAEVQYVGEIGGAHKERLLADALALVNPIAWPEPFGLVMVEALAAGTPVLTFPEGAAPEIVDDGVTGFLCRSVADMAASVAQIPTLERSKCRAAVEERFSTQRMVNDHLELFDYLLS